MDTSVSISPLVEFVLPIVLTIVTAIIGIVVPVAISYLAKKWNLQIEQSKRDALQVTLTNAAGGLVQKLGERAKELKVNVSDPHVREAVQRVVAGAPDALRWAGLTEAEIARRVLEKVPQISASPTPIADKL